MATGDLLSQQKGATHTHAHNTDRLPAEKKVHNGGEYKGNPRSRREPASRRRRSCYEHGAADDAFIASIGGRGGSQLEGVNFSGVEAGAARDFFPTGSVGTGLSILDPEAGELTARLDAAAPSGEAEGSK